MVENNQIGRKIRRYFMEVEKRYRTIVETPQNIFDFMRLAIDPIEANEKEIQNIKLLSENNLKEIEKIKYSIIYQRNTKTGVKGEIKEKGYKIDEVCYKIMIEK